MLHSLDNGISEWTNHNRRDPTPDPQYPPETAMPEPRAATVNFSEYFGDGRLLNQLQMLPEEQTWRATPPKAPARAPLLLYLGCNVLRTGHLVRTVTELFERIAAQTGIPFEAVGGPAYCCGIQHHKAEQFDKAERIAGNTLSYFAQFQPERVVMWCPSCLWFYDEIIQADVPYRVQHVSEYLLDHLDLLGAPTLQPARVALHYHNDTPARERERDAVRALFAAVPGLETIDPGCEEGWGRSCAWPAGEAAQGQWRGRAARQLEAAVAQGAGTLATMYHGCQRLLCGYESDYPLTVEHYLTVFARALGVEHADTYKRYLLSSDIEAILADAAPCMRANDVDETKARAVVERHFATGKGM